MGAHSRLAELLNFPSNFSSEVRRKLELLGFRGPPRPVGGLVQLVPHPLKLERVEPRSLQHRRLGGLLHLRELPRQALHLQLAPLQLPARRLRGLPLAERVPRLTCGPAPLLVQPAEKKRPLLLRLGLEVGHLLLPLLEAHGQILAVPDHSPFLRLELFDLAPPTLPLPLQRRGGLRPLPVHARPLPTAQGRIRGSSSGAE
mmetsp:Transcript_62191/g.140664  ORF Transcript_62191/g.140664 Transcript_62191/m.140664 type:complete len:201 (-) Transcript_62191:333-935(-)